MSCSDMMMVRPGSRSFELRIGRDVIARVSTTLLHQQQAGATIAERYNSHPDMVDLVAAFVDAGTAALAEWDASTATTEPAWVTAMRGAIARATGGK